MGRKKRRAENSRIFCFYCDRDFSTEHELVHHQKEKHLRCPTCHKRMVSTTGLVVHALQVHKRTITAVPNAIEGRDDPKVDVFGMQGVPSLESTEKQNAKRQHKNGGGLTAPSDSLGQTPIVAHVIDVPPPSLYAQYPQQIQGMGLAPSVPHAAQASITYNGGSGYGYSNARPDHVAQPVGHAYGTWNRPSQPLHAVPTHLATPGWASGYFRERQSRPLVGRPIINPVPNGLSLPGAEGAVAPHLAGPYALPSGLASVSSSGSDVRRVLPGRPAQPGANTSKPNAKPVVIVFDRADVCMEELRAQLPRYKRSCVDATSLPESARKVVIPTERSFLDSEHQGDSDAVASKASD
jgi:hypothetical protein